MDALTGLLRPVVLRSVFAVLLNTLLLMAPRTSALAGDVTIGDGTFTPRVMTWSDRVLSRVVRQRYDFSCGSAAVATLLTFSYDQPVSERETFAAMWAKGNQGAIQKAGFSLLDMQNYLAGIGLHAEGYRIPIETVIKIGIPAITLITTGSYHHFVVVRGFRNGQILVADPALGVRRVKSEDFLKIWSGIVFVIKDRSDIAAANFNDSADWRLVPDAPLSRSLDEQRVGLTGLFLNLPIGHEF